MLSTTGTIVLVVIFSLAAVLIALPRALARRERKRRARSSPDDEPRSSAPLEEEPDVPAATPPGSRPRLRDRLGRTRTSFTAMTSRLRARGRLDDEAWDELEETLLLADVGVPTTQRLLERVRARAAHEGVLDAGELAGVLAAEIAVSLDDRGDRALHYEAGEANVWLLVGVNGVGKTTTVAKLAAMATAEGHSVLLVAADTFRAAAAEQLAHWARQLGVGLVQGQDGADPGSVAFDAVEAARARGVDLVLVDTAGRLHTKLNLMAELEKVRRVIERASGHLGEVLLVLDASTGQNGLAQAREFTEAVGVTGVVLAKLDGTAKGGVVLAIEAELGVPVKLVGIGEGPSDLVAFDPSEFASALVG